ncbi:MAG: ANTAR domain-containing response regulator [Candidatus Methylomirabilia bacterium]
MNKELSILVAEDDYLISEEIVRGLNGLGYRNVTRAADGKQAVDLACSMRPDIVLMDIQMPELDGLSAALRIQERCPTPVVILTAYESAGLLEQASAAGVAAYLTKPPRPEEIERAIVVALARHADLVDLRRLNKELGQALAEVKQLRGLLPICASCKKIRDDSGEWKPIEVYISARTDAGFSHGLCPACIPKYFPGTAQGT